MWRPRVQPPPPVPEHTGPDGDCRRRSREGLRGIAATRSLRRDRPGRAPASRSPLRCGESASPRQTAQMPRLGGECNSFAAGIVAGDTLRRRSSPRDTRLLRVRVERGAGLVHPEPFTELGGRGLVPRENHSAVPAARAPPDRVTLENRDRGADPGQCPGGGESGIPSADDRHIAAFGSGSLLPAGAGVGSAHRQRSINAPRQPPRGPSERPAPRR